MKKVRAAFFIFEKNLNLRVKFNQPIRADFSDFRNSDRCLFWPNYFEKLFRPEVYFWVLGNTNSEILRPRFYKKMITGNVTWTSDLWLSILFPHSILPNHIKIRFFKKTGKLIKKRDCKPKVACSNLSERKNFVIKMFILQFCKVLAIRYSQKYSKTSKMSENYSWKN